MQAIGGGYASYADGTIFQMIPECLGEYDVTPEAVLKVMDEAGVSKAVMLQGNFLGPQNLYTYEAAKKYPVPDGFGVHARHLTLSRGSAS